MPSKILILSESFLNQDPRILVQIEALKHDYDVTCCGLVNPDVQGVAFVPLQSQYRNRLHRLIVGGATQTRQRLLFKMRQFEKSYFSRQAVLQTYARLQSFRFDLILCNDVNMLPLASRLKKKCGASLYLDAHEYTPRQWDADPKFQPLIDYWETLLKQYAPCVDLMTTVCESLATEYESEFGLKTKNLVYNVPFPEPELGPHPVRADNIRMVHHGALNHRRGPQAMIELMDHLDERFSLEFMFANCQPDDLAAFQAKAQHHPRITFRDPVPTRQISATINQYDIGLFLLDPSNFNYRNALPNKFFEFIQARLAIATWPSHEMKKMVLQHDLGIVSDNFDVASIAQTLTSLTPATLTRFKNNANTAAQMFHAERSIETIQNNVKSLLDTRR